MEETLRQNLSSCVAAYGAATGLSGAAIGLRALRDNTFFRRVLDERQGFTVRIYDRVIGWMSENWPEGAVWPAEVPRPGADASEAA